MYTYTLTGCSHIHNDALTKQPQLQQLSPKTEMKPIRELNGDMTIEHSTASVLKLTICVKQLNSVSQVPCREHLERVKAE